MRGFGQTCEAVSPVSGPVDLGCQHMGSDPDRCASCLSQQDQMNALVRLDNPYMWTHRIVPGIVAGLVVGVLVGRAMA